MARLLLHCQDKQTSEQYDTDDINTTAQQCPAGANPSNTPGRKHAHSLGGVVLTGLQLDFNEQLETCLWVVLRTHATRHSMASLAMLSQKGTVT